MEFGRSEWHSNSAPTSFVLKKDQQKAIHGQFIKNLSKNANKEEDKKKCHYHQTSNGSKTGLDLIKSQLQLIIESGLFSDRTALNLTEKCTKLDRLCNTLSVNDKSNLEYQTTCSHLGEAMDILKEYVEQTRNKESQFDHIALEENKKFSVLLEKVSDSLENLFQRMNIPNDNQDNYTISNIMDNALLQPAHNIRSTTTHRNSKNSSQKIEDLIGSIEKFHSDTYRLSNHKPDLSIYSLITMSMFLSKKDKMTLHDIYSWIMTNFGYYHTKDKWKNSVRHNLSMSSEFQKVPRPKDEPGKGGYWKLDEKFHLALLNKGLERYIFQSEEYSFLRMKKDFIEHSLLNNNENNQKEVDCDVSVCCEENNMEIKNNDNNLLNFPSQKRTGMVKRLKPKSKCFLQYQNYYPNNVGTKSFSYSEDSRWEPEDSENYMKYNSQSNCSQFDNSSSFQNHQFNQTHSSSLLAPPCCTSNQFRFHSNDEHVDYNSSTPTWNSEMQPRNYHQNEMMNRNEDNLMGNQMTHYNPICLESPVSDNDRYVFQENEELRVTGQSYPIIEQSTLTPNNRQSYSSYEPYNNPNDDLLINDDLNGNDPNIANYQSDSLPPVTWFNRCQKEVKL
ncbi:hypothetical protein SNEBB_003635 [Seison nebaliae]|nr:hypothetical protein SNEBB_003635 [Seison nebaliae]